MPQGRMKCVACDRDAGFNRAVVDRVTGREVGGYCVRCERNEFGRSLSRGRWRERDGCIFCDRDGHYALPLWTPSIDETDAGRRQTKVTYDVTDATIHLCDEHLATLRDGDEPRIPAAAPAHR